MSQTHRPHPGRFLLSLLPSLGFVAGIDLCSTSANAETSLYKSLDRGAGWFRVGQGLPSDTRINALSEEGGMILAGTDRGIYLSRDDGTNWVMTGRGAGTEARVLCFATQAGRIFAGTWKHGVLVSADSGATWQATNAGLIDFHVRSLLAVGPKLYAGTDRHGVWVSERGAAWQQQAAGLPDSAQVFDLAAVGQAVFAGLYSQGLYRWDQDRERWVKSGPVAPLELAVIGTKLVVGHNPGGVFVSDDEGKSWQDGNAGLPPGVAVWTMAANDQQVYVGGFGKIKFDSAENALFISEDGGLSWTRSDTGIPPAGAAVSFLVTRRFVLAGFVEGAPQ